MRPYKKLVRKMIYEDTPEPLKKQGWISLADLHTSLGLSRRAFYYLIERAEAEGVNLRHSTLTIGKKLFFKVADVMAALFPDEKRRSK